MHLNAESAKVGSQHPERRCEDMEKGKKTTGIVALALAVLLVFSTATMANSSEIGDEDNSGSNSNGSGTEIDLEIGEDGAEVESETEFENETEVETERENETEIENENGDSLKIKTRETLRKRIQEIRENYEERKERHENSRKNYLEVKDRAAISISEFAVVKQRWVDANVEEKQHMRTELNLKAKVALQNQVEALLKYLESVKERGAVDANRIDALIVQWQGIQLRLEDGNVTGAELLEISKDIRGTWLTHRSLLKIRIGIHINDKINDLAEKAKNFSERTKGIIESLKAEGKDTSLLEGGIAKLDAHLALYVEAHAKLKAELGAADSHGDFNEVLVKANRLMKAMHAQLKKDFRLMKALFKATRELNANAEISADTTSEITAADVEDTELADALNEFEAEVEAEGGTAS